MASGTRPLRGVLSVLTWDLSLEGVGPGDPDRSTGAVAGLLRACAPLYSLDVISLQNVASDLRPPELEGYLRLAPPAGREACVLTFVKQELSSGGSATDACSHRVSLRLEDTAPILLENKNKRGAGPRDGEAPQGPVDLQMGPVDLQMGVVLSHFEDLEDAQEEARAQKFFWLLDDSGKPEDTLSCGFVYDPGRLEPLDKVRVLPDSTKIGASPALLAYFLLKDSAAGEEAFKPCKRVLPREPPRSSSG
jgi:hypothetical protein